MSGNIIAQAIAFASYFIVTRLFSPEDIGIYNIFFSYIEVLIIFSTGKYEMATVLADSDREAMSVARFALRTNTIFSILLLTTVLAYYIISHPFLDMHKASQSSLEIGSPYMLLDSHSFSNNFPSSNFNFQLFLLVPPMVFFCGTSRVYSFLFNRKRSFLPISLSEMLGSGVVSILKVAFGFLSRLSAIWSTLGLPLATVLGKGASNLSYLLRLRKLDYPTDITKAERRSAARKFRNFPLYTMPKEFISSLSSNLPFIWLALYFDKAEVGLYGLALTFIFRPVNILNGVFEKLLNVRVAEMVRMKQSIGGFVGHFFLIVNLIALPVVVVGFLFGGDIFAFFFGDRWEGCSYYIRCLLPFSFVVLTSTSLSFLFGVFGHQRTEFLFFVILLCMRVAAIIAGIIMNDFHLGILFFCLSGVAIYLAMIAWYIFTIRRYEYSRSQTPSAFV